jgi:hypothetical protein
MAGENTFFTFDLKKNLAGLISHLIKTVEILNVSNIMKVYNKYNYTQLITVIFVTTHQSCRKVLLSCAAFGEWWMFNIPGTAIEIK